MSLVTMKEVLDLAKSQNYAVPAYDAIDYASVEAIIEGAEELNSSVIIMVPEAALPLVNMEQFFEFIIQRVRLSTVPIAVQLDHGQNFETVIKAIHYGFSSVMIDGSALSFDENVALTKKVVDIAHAAGVSVEAEIGHVGGGEGNLEGSVVDKDLYTKPEDAKKFVDATNVDALAVAFGTVHGLYKSEPKLDLDLLREIKSLVNVPLVMHGGSGVSDEEFKKAVKAGINKINIFTEISMSATEAAVSYASGKNNKIHFGELVFVAKQNVKSLVKRYIELFK